MLVEFALFDDDMLLERNSIRVSSDAQCLHLPTFNLAYQLSGEVAKLVLYNFSDRVKLKTSRLDMPIHQSQDWESIELDRYTFAFRCQIDA